MAETSPLSRLLSRLPRAGPAFAFRPPVPSLGVEVSPRRITVVKVRKRAKGFRCAGYGTAPLPEGAIETAILKCNITQPEEVVKALKQALRSGGIRPGRAALLLPDLAGRVMLMSVPELPRSRSQAEELIRFRMKRSVPFRPEEIAVSFVRLSGPAGNGAAHQVLAVMAIRAVIEQHERVLAEAGLRVGLVSLATLDLANLCRRELARIASETASGGRRVDAALLNCEPEYSTLAVFRGGGPIFFRCKIHMEGEDQDPSGRLRVLKRELSTSLSYYSEKLEGQLPLPALLCNSDPQAVGIEQVLADVGLSPAAEIDISRLVGMPAGAGDALEARLAPALGITAGRMR